MRFTLPAAVSAALFVGATTLTVASVSYAAGPVPVVGGTTLTLSDMVPGTPNLSQTPRLDAVAVTTDSALSIGTPLPQPNAAPAEPEAPATSLAVLVDRHDDNVGNLDSEMQCLASAIFYEARSESLSGKLAVARVVINRSESGRFPRSLCGVVTQPGQFSFVRGGRIPAVSSLGTLWHDSVAIARVAMADSWKSAAEGALFFHARRVSPGWARQRLAQIDNHIFYR
ncbi:cell wall hydrolase [Sphingobium sufflavum]|uniref:cell wall hydrolase n=1 Tax=Sphingobium sufflavum TaxID=1129547 RepID=UPI001F358B80|nr:cell wall hydrolase [Sphingobium sufflavum]MCE7795061.1 cell wall hydrolase [Sphingobium sufflavum]